MTAKITRSTFLYLEPTDGGAEFAQCATCRFSAKGMCLVLDHGVEPGDSCNLYLPGPSEEDEEPHGSALDDEAGFVSRQVRCENCVYFDPADGDCELFEMLNEQHPSVFKLDTKVIARGCCNAQTAKGSGSRAGESFERFA